MALPLRYTLRNVLVRRSAAALTALGIAMTTAVFAGIFSLRAGLESLYKPRGEGDVAIYLRPGAQSEGESMFTRERADLIIKERPEIVRDAQGRPVAAAETYLALYMEKLDGGLTNVALRGIQPMSLTLHEGRAELVEGRWLEFGADEVVVGRPLTERMLHCRLGDTIELNLTPFRVVGVFEHPGAEGGEVWGDADRLMAALDRGAFQRVVARVQPGTDFAALAAELAHDPRVPVKLQSEREYMKAQTSLTGGMLRTLAILLTAIMGLAAVLGSVNTMLAAVASRTHEIGVLLAIGYSRLSIFLAFVIESAVIGALGGLLGLLIALPFDGTQTGLANWNTFTDVSFAFTLTPALAGTAFGLAFALGVVGGMLPALRAAMLRPVEAFRAL